MNSFKILLVFSICLAGIFSLTGKPSQLVNDDVREEQPYLGGVDYTSWVTTKANQPSQLVNKDVREEQPYLGGVDYTSWVTSKVTQPSQFLNNDVREEQPYLGGVDYTSWVTSHRDLLKKRDGRLDYSLDTFYLANIGHYLVDWRKMSLYMFQKDHIGTGFTENDFQVTCYDQCAIDWPPLLVEGHQFLARLGLDKNLIGSIMRRDGTEQLTFNNIPLYYYYKDRRPGDIFGHKILGSGGYWYLISPNGMPLLPHQSLVRTSLHSNDLK